MNNIEEIKNRVDIVDLVSENVKLRHSGKNYTGFCPFHANTRTAAFVVWPETGTWRCFGECNEGGDIFRYIMKREGVDFKEALKMLAERAGIELQPLTSAAKEENERSEVLRKILEETVVFYRHQLRNTDAGHTAQEYLRSKRGITAETEEIWGLGYAPDSWDALINHFKQKDYPIQDLIDAGLVSDREDGRVYDRFRHRLMIPIRDIHGKMAGFGGRVLNPDDMPKFMNSPQTILFDKSEILFGLDRARKAIRSANQAVIVEGYFDVIVPHQEGFENLVSPMGTALTEAQMRQLKRFTRQFVMALDPDAAGQKATLRGLEVAREALDHEGDPVFNARGLLYYESRLKADLRVSTLPDDLDPDEIVLRDKEEWQHIVNSARPIIYHVLDALIADQDIDDPKVKSSIAAQVLPLVKDIANPIERDAYRQYIARTLKIDERALAETSPSQRKSRRAPRESQQEQASNIATQQIETANEQGKLYHLEQEIIAFLCKEPEIRFRIDRFLRECGLQHLSLSDFMHTENQEMIKIILESLEQDTLEPVDYISDRIDISQLITEVNHSPLPEEDEKKPVPHMRQLEETTRLILLARQININQEIKQLRFLQTEQQSQTVETTLPDQTLLSRLVELIRARGLVDRALAQSIKIE
jgi:DNA primase